MPDACGATLILADDMGDEPCTFTCKREQGHLGNHRESFPMPPPNNQKEVVVIWEP